MTSSPSAIPPRTFIKKWTEEALKDIGLTAANLVEEVEDVEE